MIKCFKSFKGEKILIQLEAIMAVEVRKDKVLVVTNSGYVARLNKASGLLLVECLGDWYNG